MECCLGDGEVLEIRGGEGGVTLRALRGTLWVTIGDGRDYFVREGSCFELAAGVSAVVEGLGHAEMRMELGAKQVCTVRGASIFPKKSPSPGGGGSVGGGMTPFPIG